MEIRHLRDEVITLETQIRKLKHIKSRRRRQESANSGSNTAMRSKIETENAELKAAILAQKAQLNSLIDRMQESKLLVSSRGANEVKLDRGTSSDTTQNKQR